MYRRGGGRRDAARSCRGWGDSTVTGAVGRGRSGVRRQICAGLSPGQRRYGHRLSRTGHPWSPGRGQGDPLGSRRRTGLPGAVPARGGGGAAGLTVLHRLGARRRTGRDPAVPGHRVHRGTAAGPRGHGGRPAAPVDPDRDRDRRGHRAHGHPPRGDRPSRPQTGQRHHVPVRAAGDRLWYRQARGGGAARPGPRDDLRDVRLDGAGADPRPPGRPARGRLHLGSAGRLCRYRPASVRRAGAVRAAGRRRPGRADRR